ncbi:MAG: hypothetical protein CL943_03750 [Candidatus Diapherotrites archaeon]|uniref:CBS domain-containing protein n=1 Tax=Candidatus Iainarchaeum sp. TaxID=3101447 RepID=A0A2D6M1U9_9ARCH|nr:hypothetical protein [Candidatus Diapherotrites archaeon]
MTVKDNMTRFLRVKHDALIMDAAVLMREKGTGSTLVEKEGKPVGVLTERDFLKKVVAKGLDSATVKVEEIMSAPIITIGENEKVKEAYTLMNEKNIRRLAVTNEKGEVVGKVTSHGISRSIGFEKLKKTFVDKPRQYYAGNVR